MKDISNNPELLKDAYNRLFNSEMGQAVLLDLFKEAGLDRYTIHVQGDPHSSAYHEGRRSIVWSIMIKANQDVAPYLKQALKR